MQRLIARLWYQMNVGLWCFVSNLLHIILLLQVCDHVRSKRLNTYAGTYAAFVHTIVPCPSDETFVLRFRATHFNRAKPHEYQRLTGNATVKKTLTDEVWSTVNLAVRSNNEWKENAFIYHFRKQGCTAIRLHSPEIYNLVAKYTGASRDMKTPCIVPPCVSLHIAMIALNHEGGLTFSAQGFYEVKDEPLTWTFPNFPLMVYGRYRFRVTSRDGESSNITRFCLDVDCEVVPKI